jgi:hypothetical protein
MTQTSQTKKMLYARIHNNKLYVAVEGAVEDWTCYVGTSADIDYVRKWGDKTSEDEARQLFPEFQHLMWRR